MNISNNPDNQLVRHTLKELPWLTLALCVVSLAMLFLTETDSSQAAFAFELSGSDLKAVLAFDTRAPLKGFGVPALSSFFVHDSSTHLFSNLPWFFLAGCALQKHYPKRTLLVVLAIGHLTALLGAAAAHRWAGAPPLVVGMSGGALSILLAWLFWRFKFLGWAALLTIGSVLFTTSSALFLSHAPAIMTGSLFGTLILRKPLKS